MLFPSDYIVISVLLYVFADVTVLNNTYII